MSVKKINKQQSEYFASIGGGLAQKFIKLYESQLQQLPREDKLKVVDLGGGAGHFANEVFAFFESRRIPADITVIDLFRYEELGNSNIKFIEQSATTALDSYLDDSIDVFFMNLMLHHLIGDSYNKTKQNQEELLEIAYRKLKPNGRLFVYETSTQNPMIGDLSIPIIYFMTSSKLPLLTKISKKMGSESAGTGVLFLSTHKWKKIFRKIGFHEAFHYYEPHFWKKKYLIRQQYFHFVLVKTPSK